MDTNNFIDSFFPIERTKADYRTRLSDLLSCYKKEVEKLVGPSEPSNDSINSIRGLITAINDSVEYFHKGLHCEAFRLMKKQLIDKKILASVKSYEFESGKCFYRARTFDKDKDKEKEQWSRDDMFHIPFDKRGIVETQRYSFPGFPCLYLASSIYTCWKELGGEPGSLMISAFKAMKQEPFENEKPLKLMDLRRPSQKDFLNDERTRLALPLIIACSIPVKEEGDVFKPEYIIPQLLTEIIIDANRSATIDTDGSAIIADRSVIDEGPIYGIIYTSTHMKRDTHINRFDNIAIPVVFSTLTEGHCNVLKEIFALTQPRRHEFEGEGKKEQLYYEFSKMGKLEGLMETDSFEHLPYLYWYLNNGEIGEKITITIPSSGEKQTVVVRSNIKWEITD